MDESNLIDLNNTTWGNEHKMISPLIPMPTIITSQPIISNIVNNPFDDVLYSTNENKDPFDCNLKTTPVFIAPNCKENKENIGHLISPIQTPIRPKKSLKISNKPLYLAEASPSPNSHESSLNESTSQLLNFADGNDESLQILSTSCLDVDDEFSALNNLTLTQNNFDLDELKRQSLSRQKILNILETNREIDDVKERKSLSPQKVLKVFNENRNTVLETRTSLSPRKKSPNVKSKLKEKQFNFSFSGVGFNGKIAHCKNLGSNFNESITIEANRLVEIFQMSAPIILDEDITCCTPPWEEEDIEFPEVDEADVVKDDVIAGEHKVNHEENIEMKIEVPECEEEKLHAQVLNNSASELTEHISPTMSIPTNITVSKLQRSKSDSKVHQKFKNFIAKPTALKLPVGVPTVSGGNLKVKTEKEISGKGPLKAFIPLNKMAKIKNAILKPLGSITPPKNTQTSLLQLKKAVTPESKLKSPIAQSTPNMYTQSGTKDVSPRQTFGFPVSPVNRPRSSSELPSKLPPPRAKLNNSSIPSITKITRRNSSGDISQSSPSSFNRSYEKSGNTTASKLQRSTSFQSKTSANTPPANITQNTKTSKDTLEKFVRKYGKPGKIKTLKITPK